VGLAAIPAQGGYASQWITLTFVVIGASAAGLEAISQILAALPHDLDATVLIVLHTANRAESLLPRIFERAEPDSMEESPEARQLQQNG